MKYLLMLFAALTIVISAQNSTYTRETQESILNKLYNRPGNSINIDSRSSYIIKDEGNSTQSRVMGSASFNGTPRQTVENGYTFTGIIVSAMLGGVSSGVAGNLYIDWSNDLSTWTNSQTVSVSAVTAQYILKDSIKARYYRVTYTNGNIATGSGFGILTELESNITMPVTFASSNLIVKDTISIGTTYETFTFPLTPTMVTVINDGAATDTMFISSSSSFPRSSTFRRVGGEYLSKPIAWKQLYFKFAGKRWETPKASKPYRIEVQ